MNNVYKRFESVGEFSAYLAKGTTKPEFDGYNAATEVSNKRTKFTGTESYEQADNLLLYGDRELAEKLEMAGVRQMRLKLQRQKPKRVIRASVVGLSLIHISEPTRHQ